MHPNFRREEASRLSSEAIRACTSRFPLDELRARLDSLRLHHGLEPQESRSHPETTRALDVLLERQERRQECIEGSPEYLRSLEVTEATPIAFQLPLYAGPDSASERLGTIRIRRVEDVPGPEQLAFSYRSGAQAETEWTLDRMQVEGYGGYYHTILERRGDWLRLPADPFPAPVWIDWRATFESPPEVEPIFDGVYQMTDVEAEVAGLDTPRSWDEPGIVFLRSDGDRVWFRLEGPDDGPCPELRQPEDPAGPVVDPTMEFSLGIESIVDERGHLRIGEKYGRGC
jgi:hypothetical protein